MSKIIEHPKPGTVFGKLTTTGLVLVGYTSCDEQRYYYEAKCSCGRIIQIQRQHITRANPQKACRDCSRITHGGARTKLSNSWNAMKQRCENPKSFGYRWYGKKGIKVCREFQTFESFRNWALANGYKEGLSIDRINPNKDYSPDNCQWITISENSKRSHQRTNDTP